MAKRASRKKSAKKSREPLIVAFVLIAFVSIAIEVGNNLQSELNYAKEMKAMVVAH